MRPFLLWGMSARVEWRGANAVPPAYRPTFYRCKRLTHLPQGPARVFWRSVYRSDLSKEGTWSRKQEVPALDEIFDNPGLTPLMNLPRRVRFKDFINYSDEKAIFVGLNFAIVSLFFSPWRSSNIMFISWSLLVMNISQKSVVYPGVDILCLPFFKTNCLLHQDKLSIILRRVWRSRRRCQDNGLERGLAGNPYHLLPWSSLPHNPLPNSAEKISSS